MSLENLTTALLIGCLLVIVVLVAFLYEWRTALISLTAIPLSLMSAALVLYSRGGTINTMVLAGLVIALGEVVDDAIIDVENIVRRLRAASASQAARDPRRRSCSTPRSRCAAPIVYATLIDRRGLMPVFFLEGLSGAFFRPLAISYVLAMLASMVVALTVTPALALILLRNVRAGASGSSPLVECCKRGYRAARADRADAAPGATPPSAPWSRAGVIVVALRSGSRCCRTSRNATS